MIFLKRLCQFKLPRIFHSHWYSYALLCILDCTKNRSNLEHTLPTSTETTSRLFSLSLSRVVEGIAVVASGGSQESRVSFQVSLGVSLERVSWAESRDTPGRNTQRNATRSAPFLNRWAFSRHLLLITATRKNDGPFSVTEWIYTATLI